MDHILQRLVGSSRISLLDGFSGYNQILVQLEDQAKTKFTTPWGTFMYLNTPFGLMNAGATFQRDMDIDFSKEIHDFLAVYQDDIIVFSKSGNEHLDHLRRVFIKCRKFGISLNPKKILFGLEEGKMLRHIIYKDGIRIDPARIEAILIISHPGNIKEIQSFLVKDILTQNGSEGKIGKWIATILEYDIEIKPTKVIKGQGLAKLMVELNCQALDINFISALDGQEEMETPQISEPFTDSPWYADITFVWLNLQAPPGLKRTKARFLKMKSLRYCVVDNALFWNDNNGILLTCLLKDEAEKILQEFHARDCGGHLYWKSTADKILRVGFYWPTLFGDVKKRVTSCHKCQIFEG
eukprot:PITA_22496